MKFLISQLYLLALFALPFVSTSCSDDDDNSTKVEISSLGVEDGTTIVTGQIIQLEAQLSNPQGEVHYSWSTAGKEVSTQSTYTFQSDVTGTHTITLTVTANNEAQEKSINIIVVKPPFYVINEGQGKGSVNRYKQEQWQYNIVEGLGVTSTVGIINIIGRIRESWYEKTREMLLFFYYPSDEYISYLMTVEELEFLDEIDCQDLFDGKNPRERILVFQMGEE